MVFVPVTPTAMVVDWSFAYPATATATSIRRYWPFCGGQEEDCERLAGSLYTKGLTQEQVCEVFEEFYGDHYSKASVSRMLDFVLKDAGPPRCGRFHSS